MNKDIASLFSFFFAILTIVATFILIFSIVGLFPIYGVYSFFFGLLFFILFIIVFGFLAVVLDIRDEIILIREKIVGDSGPKKKVFSDLSDAEVPSYEDRPFFSLGKNPNLPSKDDKSEKNN